MAGRPPARHPGRGAWEASYPDTPYRDGWHRDGAGDDPDRAGASFWQHAAEDDREDAGGGYRGTRHGRDTTGGATGNERLTALLLAVLTVHQAGSWTGLPDRGH